MRGAEASPAASNGKAAGAWPLSAPTSAAPRALPASYRAVRGRPESPPPPPLTRSPPAALPLFPTRRGQRLRAPLCTFDTEPPPSSSPRVAALERVVGLRCSPLSPRQAPDFAASRWG